MTSAQDTWVVTVETFEQFTSSVDVLECVAAGLEANPSAHGPAASLDRLTGVLSATMAVDASSQSAAAEQAITVFYDALGRAGFNVDRPGWSLKLEIEPANEPAVTA
jgi:hypothetical protein